ncbi:MAG: adenylate/guanylate cyclase domain-containing protein [Caldimonas sp.]
MPQTEFKQRLAAILAADAAGYSRLMSLDEQATVATLDAARAVFRAQIEAAQGRVIDMAGDSVLALFDTASGAVTAALAIQADVNALAESAQEARRMRFRIGVHLGDVIEKSDGTVYGDGVNIAARLESLAEPGGITVSDMVHSAVRDRISVAFEDAGEHSVKNIARPVRTFRVIPPSQPQERIKPSWQKGSTPSTVDSREADEGNPIDGRDAEAAPTTARPVRRLSVVVLPFVNSNGAELHDYFTDGITEDVTSQLSSIKNSYVIGRNTAIGYKDKPIDVQAIGRELGVRYVLRGWVDRLEQGIDTTVRLADTATGESVWEDTIEVDFSGVRNIRREVVSRLTMALKLPLINAEARRSLIEHPTDPDVVDLVMQGRATFYGRYTLDANRHAQALFERALLLKPDDQPALVGCAFMLVDQVYAWLGRSGIPLLDRAEELLQKALPLDWHDAYAHYALSRLRHLQGRIESAIAENQTALELNPNFVEAIAWSGFLHTYNGRPELALEPLHKVVIQSPKDRMRWSWYLWLGAAYLLTGRYGEAILWLEKSTAINSGFWASFALLGAAYHNSGDDENAMAAKKRFDEVYAGEDLDFRRHSRNRDYIALMEERVMPALQKIGIAIPAFSSEGRPGDSVDG